MTGPAPFSFGYGSLVNRDTHAFTETYPARLRGWRRRWCHWVDAPFGTCTSLTVVPQQGASISGLVMATPHEDHAALNARERGYDRIRLAQQDLDHAGPAGIAIDLYQSRKASPGGPHAPILQSYLDTVLQGFEREFGPTGLQDFLHETEGWETPVLRDRANPVYPRATPIGPAETARYDTLLAAFGVRYIESIG